MAVGYRTYGPWVPSSGAAKRMRLRFEWSVATPSPGATTVPVTLIVSVEAGNWFWDGQARYSRSGALGSRNQSIRVEVRPSGGSTVIDRVTTDVPIYADGAYMISASASLSGVDYIGAGVTASHTSSIPLPGRVSGTPGAPRPVAQYVSDDRAVISWGATDLADRYYVEQWSEAHQRWWRLGTVYGTSITDYGLSPNNRYKWRVAAGNSSAYDSPWNETGGIRTTPNAPILRVVRKASTLEVHITSNAAYAQNWQLERRRNGGSWEYWTQLEGESNYATMQGDGNDVWEFRGRSGVVEGGQRWSAWTVTDPVRPLAAPNAPTLLAPVGIVSTDASTLFRWRHDPRDLTEQTAAEFRWRRADATDWEPARQATPPNSSEYAAIPLQVGEYVWQCRTKGQHPDWGPWAEPVGFTVAAPPRFTITSPAEGETLRTNLLTVQVDATESNPDWQIDSWEARLTHPDGQLVTEWRGVGHPTSIECPYRLADDTRYQVAVRLHSTSTLWTQWRDVQFAVDYAEPAKPLLVAVFREPEGNVALTAEAQDGEIAAARLRIEYSRDHGRTWHRLAEGDAPTLQATDPLPRLGDEMSYRAVAISALPSESQPTETTIGTPTDRLWINPDGAPAVWALGDLSIQPSTQQEMKLEHYLGAAYPTPHWGEQRTTTVRLGFRTLGRVDDSLGPTEEAWTVLLGRRLTYRDPEGRILRCVLEGDMSIQQTRRGLQAWSMTLAVIDG